MCSRTTKDIVCKFDAGPGLGVSAEDAYFADGLTKDINAHLSKFSNLFVFAPSAVSSFRDNADCKKIRSELQAIRIIATLLILSDSCQGSAP